MAVLLVALLVGCSARTEPRPTPLEPGGTGTSPVIVGSFDFPESVLLAHLYAEALANAGIPTEVVPGLGTREIVEPALLNGHISLLPEYAGSALDFLSLGQVTPTADVNATHLALSKSASDRGLIAAAPAPAQNTNAVVVTEATAARYQLESIQDLAGVAHTMVFGGPPECPERRYCLLGLESAYGLHFAAFVPTDAGGPLTRQALTSGQVDVGLLFTTDAQLAAKHLVVLVDNRGLQPAENVTPLVRQETVADYGRQLIQTLDAVSAKLSTAALSSLNLRAEQDGADPAGVAQQWLTAQGLVEQGEAQP